MANPISATQFREAIGDTEKEIFQHSFLETAPEQNDDDGNLVEQLSQVTGWDGMPLSDEEGIARAMQGDEVDGVLSDRPLQHQHDQEIERLKAQAEARVALKDAEIAEWRQRYDPQIQEQASHNRDAFMDNTGLVAVDDAKANAYFGQIAAIEQQRNQLWAERGWQSLERAREKYGEAFDKTEANFNRLDLTRNTMARAAAQHIQGAADPGEALMAAADTIASLVDPQNGWQPPFARTREPDYRPSRWPSHGDVEDSGYDPNSDNEIFRDAVRR